MPDDYDGDGAPPSSPGGKRRAPDSDQPRRRRRSLDDDGGLSVSDLVERHSASRTDLPAAGRRRAPDESRHAAPEPPRRGGIEDLGAAVQGRKAAAEQNDTPPARQGRRRAPEQSSGETSPESYSSDPYGSQPESHGSEPHGSQSTPYGSEPEGYAPQPDPYPTRPEPPRRAPEPYPQAPDPRPTRGQADEPPFRQPPPTRRAPEPRPGPTPDAYHPDSTPDVHHPGPAPETHRRPPPDVHRPGPSPDAYHPGSSADVHHPGPAPESPRGSSPDIHPGPMPETHRGPSPDAHRPAPVAGRRPGPPPDARRGPSQDAHRPGPSPEGHHAGHAAEGHRPGPSPDAHQPDHAAEVRRPGPAEARRPGPSPDRPGHAEARQSGPEEHQPGYAAEARRPGPGEAHRSGPPTEINRPGHTSESHRGGPSPDVHGAGHAAESHRAGPPTEINRPSHATEARRGGPSADVHGAGHAAEGRRTGPPEGQRPGNAAEGRRPGSPVEPRQPAPERAPRRQAPGQRSAPIVPPVEPGGPHRASVPADVVRQATGTHRVPDDAPGLDFDQFIPAGDPAEPPSRLAPPPARPAKRGPEPTQTGDFIEDDRPSKYYPVPGHEPFPRDHRAAATSDDHFPVDRGVPEPGARPRPGVGHPRDGGEPPRAGGEYTHGDALRSSGPRPDPRLGGEPSRPDGPPRLTGEHPLADEPPRPPGRRPLPRPDALFADEPQPTGAQPHPGRRQPTGAHPLQNRPPDERPAGRRPTGSHPVHTGPPDEPPAFPPGRRPQPTGAHPLQHAPLDDPRPAGRGPHPGDGPQHPAGRASHPGDEPQRPAGRGPRQSDESPRPTGRGPHPTGAYPVDEPQRRGPQASGAFPIPPNAPNRRGPHASGAPADEPHRRGPQASGPTDEPPRGPQAGGGPADEPHRRGPQASGAFPIPPDDAHRRGPHANSPADEPQRRSRQATGAVPIQPDDPQRRGPLANGPTDEVHGRGRQATGAVPVQPDDPQRRGPHANGPGDEPHRRGPRAGGGPADEPPRRGPQATGAVPVQPEDPQRRGPHANGPTDEPHGRGRQASGAFPIPPGEPHRRAPRVNGPADEPQRRPQASGAFPIPPEDSRRGPQASGGHPVPPRRGPQPTGAYPMPTGPLDEPQRPGHERGRQHQTGGHPVPADDTARRSGADGVFPDDRPPFPEAPQPSGRFPVDAGGEGAQRLTGDGKPRIPRQQPPGQSSMPPGQAAHPEETARVALTPPPGVSGAEAAGLTTEMEPIGEATQKRRRVDQTLARFSKVHDELKAEERAKRAKRRLPRNAEDAELEDQLDELAKPPGESAQDDEERPKPRKRSLFARVFAGTTAILVFIATGVGWSFIKNTGDNIDKVRALDPESSAIQNADAQRGDENFLLVGSDTREGAESEEGVGDASEVPGARADTMMIAHIPADRSRVVIVSFPRDLEIDRPECERFDPKSSKYTGEQVAGQSTAKMNSAYQVGGPLCATKVVQRLSGLRITRFIGIDFHGFKGMVEAVDGVTVCVEEPMYDTFMKKWIVQQSGEEVVLRGDQALDFVRARQVRGDPTSDYGRIKRQQRFLSSLLRKSMSAQVLLDPSKLTGFTEAFTSSTFGDNITVDSLFSLGQSLQRLEAGRVTFLTVPTVGTSNRRGNEELRVEDNAALFRAIVNNQPLPGEKPAADGEEQRALPQSSPLRARLQQADPKKLKIQVLNGGNEAGGIARRTADKLAAFGYQVVFVNSAPEVSHTVVYYSTGNETAARTLASSIPGTQLKADRSMGNALALVLGPEYDGQVVAPGTAEVAEPEPEKLPADLSAINGGDVTCA
ncbi:LCP family glycopolymer transferase [Actinokineospora sp. 24-640]